LPDDPPPLATVAYFDEGQQTEWSTRLVKLLGIAGLMMGGADLLSAAVDLFPYWPSQTRSTFSIYVGLGAMRPGLLLFGWGVSTVLTVGSVACLARARFARPTMMTYAVVALVYAASWSIARPFGLGRGTVVAWLPQVYLASAFGLVRMSAFPVLVLGVMRLPAVRRLFSAPYPS
jgi:hypothetical protein